VLVVASATIGGARRSVCHALASLQGCKDQGAGTSASGRLPAL